MVEKTFSFNNFPPSLPNLSVPCKATKSEGTSLSFVCLLKCSAGEIGTRMLCIMCIYIYSHLGSVETSKNWLERHGNGWKTVHRHVWKCSTSLHAHNYLVLWFWKCTCLKLFIILCCVLITSDYIVQIFNTIIPLTYWHLCDTHCQPSVSRAAYTRGSMARINSGNLSVCIP